MPLKLAGQAADESAKLRNGFFKASLESEMRIQMVVGVF
jgi:hypothetical protein